MACVAGHYILITIKINTMPKVILEFDSFEDAEEIRSALDGAKWKGVVWDIDQHLRNTIKHSDDSVSEETITAIEKIREKLNDLVHSDHLSL